LGPCIAACTQADYAQQIRRLRRFLEGHDLGLLQDWTQAMQQAARDLRFEKAQSLKDRLQPLQWLQDRLLFLRQARSQGDFVYPCPAEDGRNLWLLIHRGEVVGAVREPQSDASRAAARALLQSGFRLPAGESDLTDRTVDSVLLLHAWFRKHPAEKAKLLTRAQAEALCAGPVAALPCPAAKG
jgi:excinuclease ABC subunit C